MSLQAAFKTFASKNNNTEATTTDINKWCKDAGVYGKNLTSNHTDIAYNKAKVKGAKNITFNELDALIAEMAIKYKDDKKIELDQAISELKDKLANASSQLHGTTKTMKVGGVDRLTDTSKYTGSHKERFDETGKGKGMSGRENLTDNSGYVGAYKGSGTYNKSHWPGVEPHTSNHHIDQIMCTSSNRNYIRSSSQATMKKTAIMTEP